MSFSKAYDEGKVTKVTIFNILDLIFNIWLTQENINPKFPNPKFKIPHSVFSFGIWDFCIFLEFFLTGVTYYQSM
jgi:hypothetical protein